MLRRASPGDAAADGAEKDNHHHERNEAHPPVGRHRIMKPNKITLSAHQVVCDMTALPDENFFVLAVTLDGGRTCRFYITGERAPNHECPVMLSVTDGAGSEWRQVGFMSFYGEMDPHMSLTPFTRVVAPMGGTLVDTEFNPFFSDKTRTKFVSALIAKLEKRNAPA